MRALGLDRLAHFLLPVHHTLQYLLSGLRRALEIEFVIDFAMLAQLFPSSVNDSEVCRLFARRRSRPIREWLVADRALKMTFSTISELFGNAELEWKSENVGVYISNSIEAIVGVIF